jgi:hypothetical protein
MGTWRTFIAASNSRKRTASPLRAYPARRAFWALVAGVEWLLAAWAAFIWVSLEMGSRVGRTQPTKLIGAATKSYAGGSRGRPKSGKMVSVSRNEFHPTMRSPANSRTMSAHGW